MSSIGCDCFILHNGLKMDTNFQDIFEQNNTENNHLGIVLPPYAADSVWQNQSEGWINAYKLKRQKRNTAENRILLKIQKKSWTSL